MKIDDQIKDSKFNTALIKKLQEYQPYHVAKLISMNISQMNKYYLSVKNK